jgi:hypothetical protein
MDFRPANDAQNTPKSERNHPTARGETMIIYTVKEQNGRRIYRGASISIALSMAHIFESLYKFDTTLFVEDTEKVPETKRH